MKNIRSDDMYFHGLYYYYTYIGKVPSLAYTS